MSFLFLSSSAMVEYQHPACLALSSSAPALASQSTASYLFCFPSSEHIRHCPPMDIDADKLMTKSDWKTPASMVLVQFFITGMILLSKVSIGDGMFIFALLAYRSLFGAAFILPLALIFEREKWREMGWRAMGWIFLNAFIGYGVPMSLYFYGLRDTTPSYAVIFLNMIPLFSFTLSLVFRMETFRILNIAGSLKIVGVLLTVGGTMLISLYKGKTLHLWDPILKHYHEEQQTVASNQLRGTIFLVGSSFTFACWYLIQSKVLKVYPYKYWSSMATCLFGGFQTAIIGIILRRDKNAWKLGWDLNLLTILYSGALATAAKYSLNSWVVAKRGPAYPPMFNPLSVVFTIVLDSIFIGDDITVGGLLGTVTVIVGLYIFLWAKSKEVPDPKGATGGAGHGALGFTHHKPGASTWHRIRKSDEVAVGSSCGGGGGSSVGILGLTGDPANCLSPALGSAAAGSDHDPWPTRAQSPNHSMATQDSREGGFSAPPMAREHYVGLDAGYGCDATGGQADVQGKIQLGSSSSAATQVVCDDFGGESVEMDLEAAAPGRQGRHEGPTVELPRHGQEPWQ